MVRATHPHEVVAVADYILFTTVLDTHASPHLYSVA